MALVVRGESVGIIKKKTPQNKLTKFAFSGKNNTTVDRIRDILALCSQRIGEQGESATFLLRDPSIYFGIELLARRTGVNSAILLEFAEDRAASLPLYGRAHLNRDILDEGVKILDKGR